VVGTGVTPADEETVGWFNFEVAAADRYATDVNGEFAARMWVDHGVLAHPGDERFGTGEELEDLLRGCVDVDRGGDWVSGHRRRPPLS